MLCRISHDSQSLLAPDEKGTPLLCVGAGAAKKKTPDVWTCEQEKEMPCIVCLVIRMRVVLHVRTFQL